MCLSTHLKNPLVATEDITVYKVLRYDYPYEDCPPFYANYIYHKGLNVPDEGCDGKVRSDGLYGKGWLHAYTSKSSAMKLSTVKKHSKIVKMIIPRGAIYFISDEYDDECNSYIEGDEICANALFWPYEAKF